jgi:hypothetical protein
VREKEGEVTFATGRLPGGDVEHLGRHPHGTLDLQVLALGALHQIAADCSKRRKETRGKLFDSNPNAAETKEMASTVSQRSMDS